MRPASSRRAGSVHFTKVLVTGATGYIGGRQAPRLLDDGHRVRVLARSAARVRSRSWAERVKIVEGDALDRDTLSRALAGVDCAYYLIHSMGSGAGFHELDVEAARLFGQVAGEAGVRRIVYLGGLGDPKADLSRHLRSRQETGRALREGGVRGDGVQGGGDRRLGQHLLRDDPLSGGASPGDGVPAVGLFAGPAYRGERCARTIWRQR